MSSRGLVRDFVTRAGAHSLVSTATGRAHFRRAIATPRDWGSGLVHIGDAERRLIGDRMPAMRSALGAGPAADGRRGAFLGAPVHRGVGQATWSLSFDETQARLIAEHPVGGVPTLPATLVAALVAEAAAALLPGLRAHRVRDIRFRKFIRVRPGDRVRHLVRAELAAPDSATVTITSEATAPDGTPLRRGVVHTTASVDLIETLPPPPPPPAVPVDAVAAADPYYQADSPILLHGAFRNTRDLRATAGGGVATWAPPAVPDAGFYGRMHLPALLIDALARTTWLRPPGTPGVPVSIPTRIACLETYAMETDTSLASFHPQGVTLVQTEETGAYHAVTAAGRVLVSFHGLETYPLGWVDLTPSGSPTPTEYAGTR